jgi:hypothetical protein
LWPCADHGDHEDFRLVGGSPGAALCASGISVKNVSHDRQGRIKLAHSQTENSGPPRCSVQVGQSLLD